MTSFAQKYRLIPTAIKDCDDTKRATFYRGEKDVVGIVTFDLIGLLPTNHIILYITMAYRSL